MSELLCSDQGGLFFFMEEAGQLKTDLGECIKILTLNVTRPDGGECFKILVSCNPEPKANL